MIPLIFHNVISGIDGTLHPIGYACNTILEVIRIYVCAPHFLDYLLNVLQWWHIDPVDFGFEGFPCVFNEFKINRHDRQIDWHWNCWQIIPIRCCACLWQMFNQISLVTYIQICFKSFIWLNEWPSKTFFYHCFCFMVIYNICAGKKPL